MLVIQLSFSDSGMPVKSYYYFSYESVLDFLRESTPRLREWMKHSAHECSALREVHIVLDTNKTYSKRRDYLFSFNLNLDLFTLALENLYFNTLDQEKVQGKSLGCIKSLGTPHPRTPIQGATAKGWKSRGLPTPDLGLYSRQRLISSPHTLTLLILIDILISIGRSTFDDNCMPPYKGRKLVSCCETTLWNLIHKYICWLWLLMVVALMK